MLVFVPLPYLLLTAISNDVCERLEFKSSDSSKLIEQKIVYKCIMKACQENMHCVGMWIVLAPSFATDLYFGH